MSEDTTVNIKGTFSVKHREHNGLNRVADLINGDRLVRVPIVGYVVFHQHTETVQGDRLTVSLEAVEPCIEPDGTDPAGIGRDTMAMLDRLRKAAGKALVADTLFVNGPSPELDGQLEAITRGDVEGTYKPTEAEMDAHDREKYGPAEKSGEELLAERSEGTPAADLDVEDEGRAGSPHEPSDPEQVTTAALAGVKTRRTPRGARVRPATADPFTPGDPAHAAGPEHTPEPTP